MVDSDNMKYEFEINSESVQTAEQTEKQNKSEKVLEKLASGVSLEKKLESAEAYAFDKIESTKKSGHLKPAAQIQLVQQDTSPARTFKTDKNTNS